MDGLGDVLLNYDFFFRGCKGLDLRHMSMIYFSVSNLYYERDILASLLTEYSKLVTSHATQFVL